MKKGALFFRTFAILASLIVFVGFASLPLHGETQEIRNASNRRYLDETLRAIEKAKQSIFFVMYHLPLDPSNKSSPVTRLVDALIQAKMRGVDVRVILDQEIKSERSRKGAPMKNLRAYHYLKENGVPVSFDSLSKRTHAKLLVIDLEIVILGSTNWSREAINENYEANLWVRSPETAEALLEDFKSIELLQPEKTAPSQENLRISRKFLLDKNQGPRLLDEHAERAFRVYLFLLWVRHPEGPQAPKDPDPSTAEPALSRDPSPSSMAQDDEGEGRPQDDDLSFDYEEAAKLLGIAHMSREAYRRQIIKVLRKLARDYKLIRFEPRHGKDAVVTLVDPAPQEDYFEIPRGFFEWGWLETLPLRAQYALLILYDQAAYPRTSPTIKVGLQTLEKRYGADIKTLGLGFRELAHEDLLEIYYGRAIDFAKKEFETASYVLLPFYDPLVREQKLRELEALYGKEAFRQAQESAGAFFKEKDPAVIETLMGLRWTYSPEWLDLAMKKVILEKSVGNPARSLPYLIGILKDWKEKGRPAFPPASD